MLDEAVTAKSNGRCWYCGEGRWHNCNPTTDHQLPRSRGGTDYIDNRVVACNCCNRDKGAMTVEEFRNTIAGELYSQLLALGVLNPPIPRVRFFGEVCTPGPMRFCRQREAELAKLEPNPADPIEVRKAKANRRKRLRRKFRREAYYQRHGVSLP